MVREYIEAHYAEDISVEDLADLAQVSRIHLTRSFLNSYGMPPHGHLNAVRLRAAKSLLELGHPIAHVAVEVGYADQSHLTRRFKGTYGIPPGAWLRQSKSRLPRLLFGHELD